MCSVDFIFQGFKHTVYAKDAVVREIDPSEIDSSGEIGLHGALIRLGCYLDNKLLGTMTFSRPRFSSKYDYEIISVDLKYGYLVIGGAEKLFEAFLNTYDPDSVVAYTDLRSDGSVYKQLGFSFCNEVSEPEYMWIKGNDIKSRYETQKSNLIAEHFELEHLTEDEIMYNLGYTKIYSHEDLKYTWYKK